MFIIKFNFKDDELVRLVHRNCPESPCLHFVDTTNMNEETGVDLAIIFINGDDSESSKDGVDIVKNIRDHNEHTVIGIMTSTKGRCHHLARQFNDILDERCYMGIFDEHGDGDHAWEFMRELASFYRSGRSGSSETSITFSELSGSKQSTETAWFSSVWSTFPSLTSCIIS